MTYAVSDLSTGLAVKISIPEYRVNPGDTPSSVDLKITDRVGTYTIGSDTYSGLGQLLNITASRSELRTSSDTVTISISGIPNDRVKEILNSKIKGAKVSIYRFFPAFGYGPGTQYPPIGRFFGIVNNYSIEETFDFDGKNASSTVSLVCSSKIDILNNKITGRRTNPQDQSKFYPNDPAFDRVPSLSGTNFNFGAPQ